MISPVSSQKGLWKHVELISNEATLPESPAGEGDGRGSQEQV